MLVLAMMGYSASAQNDDKNGSNDQSDKRQNYNRLNPRLFDQLSLTATQSEQVKVINDDYRTKMQDMIKSDLSIDDRKAKKAVYEAERRTKLLAVLTPTQIQKLHELQKSPGAGDEKDIDYKMKTKSEDGEKTKVKVKIEND